MSLQEQSPGYSKCQKPFLLSSNKNLSNLSHKFPLAHQSRKLFEQTAIHLLAKRFQKTLSTKRTAKIKEFRSSSTHFSSSWCARKKTADTFHIKLEFLYNSVETKNMTEKRVK
jgi:hypothetical protein